MSTVAGHRVLVNERARVAIRSLVNSIRLRDIDDMWLDEGFAAITADPEPVGGQRVTRFQGYLNGVDWTSPSDVIRALHVFETALRLAMEEHGSADDEWATSAMDRVRRLLARDGYELTASGRIVGGPVATIADDMLGSVSDPSVLREHLDRMERAVGSGDPAQVIGSAKELMESTAKLALRTAKQPVPKNADIPELVRLVQIYLRIHPESVVDGIDGSKSIKKILGATTTIPAGIAELRNAGYGTGHGHDRPPTGLRTRHARLAANAARTWCEFVLDTLSDETAPWRQASPAINPADTWSP